MAGFDHWRFPDRDWVQPKPYSPPKKEERPPPGPRLNMTLYTYPPDFCCGQHERVRLLNKDLLRLYRRIGFLIDYIAERNELYDITWGFGELAEAEEAELERHKKELSTHVGDAELRLAELDGMGCPYHIPDGLNARIAMKPLVRRGTLAHLPGVNFYCSELMDDIPNATPDQKLLLEEISFTVNRLIFLQECGAVFRERPVYAGLYKVLKAKYKKLEDSDFQVNLKPALIDRARLILHQEPRGVRVEREKAEERQRRKEERKQRERVEEQRREEERKQRERVEEQRREETWEEWFELRRRRVLLDWLDGYNRRLQSLHFC